MRNILLVAWREFRQRVRKRAFLFTSLGTPLILLVVWLFTGSFGEPAGQPAMEDLLTLERPEDKVGYVDQAGLIQAITDPVPSDLFYAFDSVEAARAALQSAEIDAYYVVPPDYVQTADLQRVSERLPTLPPDEDWFKWVLVSNLFPEASRSDIARFRWPFNNDGGPRFVSLTPVGKTGQGSSSSILPFVVALAVMVPLFTSGSLLLQSLAQEKSNRVMEMLLVSLRPRQLLAGKLLGLGALTLVQYAAWMIIGGVVLLMAGSDAVQFLSSLSLSLSELALVLPYALGGFVLYAALMAGIGALTQDVESSRTWVFLITLPMTLPIYLWMSITSSPNGPLAIILSLVPFSSPMTMLMRMTSTVVPGWQIGLSLALLVLAGVGMVWLMGRLFRVQTLLSGESISLRRVWSALTS
jgi:ABC-2 type transport system permease protein